MSASRYSRQVSLPEWGEAGQRKLATSTVLIIGLGGLGNPASMYLAGAGVGRLLLNDFDTVDNANLSRQLLFRAADCGRAKVAVAAAALRDLNSDCAVETLDRRLDAAQLAAAVDRADVVIDASDNFATRFAVNAACLRSGVPLVSGAAIRYEGQLAVFRHDLDGQACYRCLYDEQAEALGDCEGQGVLSPLTGVIGATMAVEAMRLIVGFGADTAGTVLVHDARCGDWRRLSLQRRESCPACGAQSDHQQQRQ